jgi:hypothetical protein
MRRYFIYNSLPTRNDSARSELSWSNGDFERRVRSLSRHTVTWLHAHTHCGRRTIVVAVDGIRTQEAQNSREE